MSKSLAESEGTTHDVRAVAATALDHIRAYRHDDALILIERTLESMGGPIPAALGITRGRALAALERYGAAMELLWPITKDPNATPLERAHAQKLYGRTLYQTWGDLDVAIDLAREAARTAERAAAAGATDTGTDEDLLEMRVTAHADAARAFARKRARGAAEREIAAARALLGDQENAYLLAAEAAVCLDFDDRAAARERYAKAAGLPKGGDRMRALGHAFVARLCGDFAEAHRQLDSIQPVGKCDLGPRRERVALFVAERRWEEAAAAWAALLAASPQADSARWWKHERAGALFHAGRRHEALAVYQDLASHTIEDRAAKGAKRLASRLGDPARKDARKLRLQGFRTVAQLRDHCGPACCELYLGFFGIPGDQVEIARQIKLPNSGTPLYAMRSFLEGAGLEARRVEADIDGLRTLIDLGLPAILEEEYSTTRHVAVAIGYDDEREVLEVQDPMTHEIRETPYEDLPRLLALANHGALIGVPKGDTRRLAALDAAGLVDCKYIVLVDEAWKAFDQQRFEDAAKLCDEAIALRRDYELAWICKFTLARQGKITPPGGLEAILDVMLELWPDDEWPQQYVGYTLYHQGRYGEALGSFERARDRDPGDGNNWAMIGDCLIAVGRRMDAIQPLYEALRRMPWHVRSNENLADLLEQRGDTGRADALNDAAIDLNPQNPFNYEVQARLCERRGDVAAALACYEKALEVDPKRGWASAQRARTLAQLGRIDDAVQALRERIAAAQHPNEAQSVRIDLADMLYRHGRSEAAIGVCDEILASDANAASGYAIKGASLGALGKLDEAVPVMRKALALRPAYGWVYTEMGTCFARAGRFGEAVEAFAAATGLHSSANNRFFLGSALADAGAMQDAVANLKSAADSGAIDEGKLVRCAEVIARVEGVASARGFLDRIAQGRKGDLQPLRAQARLNLEVFWSPWAAEAVLGQIATVAPEDPWALAFRGKKALASSLEKEPEGEVLLRRAMAAIGWARTPKVWLAEALATRGRHEESLALLAQLAPAPVVLKARVKSLLELGRDAEAAALVPADAIAKNDFAGLERAYELAKHRRDWPGALAVVEKLAHLGGENEDDGRLDHWEIEKFRCLLRVGEIERAERFGAKQVGNAADASYLAHVALALDRPEVGRAFAERALALNPKDTLGLGVLARVKELAGDLDGAMQLWRAAAEADPKDHAAIENQARLLLASGAADAALPLADRAVALAHLCPWAFGVRAQTRVLRGDREGAQADLERSWSLADASDRATANALWAVRAALAGDREGASALRTKWTQSSELRSTADEARIEHVLRALLG